MARRKSGQTVKMADVQECLDILAKLILHTGDTYVRLYLRLERELDNLDEFQAAVLRIRERARKHK